MSADNGIYILQTPYSYGKCQYRVAYHMAVENFMWDDIKGEESQDPDVWIKNARKMWPGPVFYTREDALKEADKLYQEHYGPLECSIYERIPLLRSPPE